MTRKHFIEIAKIVAAIDDHRTRWWLTSQLASVFKTVNHRFDSEKFRAACNPEGGGK